MLSSQGVGLGLQPIVKDLAMRFAFIPLPVCAFNNRLLPVFGGSLPALRIAKPPSQTG